MTKMNLYYNSSAFTLQIYSSFNPKTPAQMFSCDFCKISKNNFS